MTTETAIAAGGLVVVVIGWIHNNGKVSAILDRLVDDSKAHGETLDEHDARLNAHGEKLTGHAHDLSWLKRQAEGR